VAFCGYPVATTRAPGMGRSMSESPDNQQATPANAVTVLCPVCDMRVPVGAHCVICGIALPGNPESLPPIPEGDRGRVLKVVFYPLATLAVLLLLGIVLGNAPSLTGLLLVVAAALLPAVIYAAIVIRLDHYEPEPPAWMLAALLWGAIGATSLTIITSLSLSLGSPADREFIRTVAAAPLIEESFKAIALVVLTYGFRHELDNTLDGLLYGGLIGIGFAFTENILYFERSYSWWGISGLGISFLMRAVIGGWGHCVWTGIVGAGIGWARGRYRKGFIRFVVPVVAFVVAVSLHYIWNIAAFITEGYAGSTSQLIRWELISATLVIFPALVLLYVVARVSRKRQMQIIKQQLKDEVTTGFLTPGEYAVLTSDDLRKRSLRRAKTIDPTVATEQRRFFNTAVELAFLKNHVAMGEHLDQRRIALLARYRRSLADLRPNLPDLGSAA